ncbi:MAG TPA: pyridoxal-phosphate dependent enzyme, partial [Alphaproteobacteria bacterium]|nr:pyridoxal-phosphate dependent enzyme [Alphaproteobacteria bacterium]
MDVRDGFVGTIGNTPLIRLRKASEITGCEIYGKAEFLNPGGSVKDRAALAIITDAERRGELKPGGIIVEGTAGNTGIGLALVGNARGYRTVIVIPETQTQEKKDTLRLCGAELVEVPAVPYRDPNNYVKYSGRLAEEYAGKHPEGAIWANQFDNVANRQGHYETTGPEIWEDTEGKIDILVSGVGTGGTLTGVGRRLKEHDARVRVVCVIPEAFPGIEGLKPLGHPGDIVPAILDEGLIDERMEVGAEEAHAMCVRLARTGFFAGQSSG